MTYADARGQIRVADVDTRRELWRSAPIADLRALRWSAGGGRLLALTARRVAIFDRGGRVLHERAVGSGGAEALDAAWAPAGDRIAVARRHGVRERSDIVLISPAPGRAERLLFSGPGRFGIPAWSPDGTRLLVPWPTADQWLFLRPGAAPRVSAVANIAAQFDPGASRPASPGVAGWCCPAGRGGP